MIKKLLIGLCLISIFCVSCNPVKTQSILTPSPTFVRPSYDFRKYADEYVISQVGKEYFEKYFEYVGDTFYPEDTPNSNKWIVKYIHIISIGDYSQDLGVTVWFNYSNGSWELGNGYDTIAESLPNCISDKSKCMPFSVTREQAIEIARENGILDNVTKYEARISFFGGNINSYVWNVGGPTSEIRGKGAIIDLNTGEILSATKYVIIIDQVYTPPSHWERYYPFYIAGIEAFLLLLLLFVFINRKGKKNKDNINHVIVP